MRFTSPLTPDRYHGHRKHAGFFEGWYFRLVDAGATRGMAVIPGVFMSRDGANRFGFVMTVDAETRHVAMHRYPIEDVRAATDTFAIAIGPNRFAADGLTLDLTGEAGTLRGTLAFHDVTPWPVTLRAPGAMGWYAYMPFMECFHGIVSLDHTIAGTLATDRGAIDFTGGRGYTEKDWGRNFPASWVWMQANHFPEPRTTLTASVAVIPFLGTTFGGAIVGLLLDGTLYRFTTYTGARICDLAVDDDRVRMTVEDARHRLEVTAARGPGALLYAPTAHDMVPRVEECLQALLTVRLRTRAGRTVYEGASPSGALEVQGDLPRLRRLLGLAS